MVDTRDAPMRAVQSRNANQSIPWAFCRPAQVNRTNRQAATVNGAPASGMRAGGNLHHQQEFWPLQEDSCCWPPKMIGCGDSYDSALRLRSIFTLLIFTFLQNHPISSEDIVDGMDISRNSVVQSSWKNYLPFYTVLQLPSRHQFPLRVTMRKHHYSFTTTSRHIIEGTTN